MKSVRNTQQDIQDFLAKPKSGPFQFLVFI